MMPLEYLCSAVVFCGGKGTRMRSLLGDQPKALMQLNGQTYLDGLLRMIYRAGIRNVILAVSPLTMQIATAIGDGRRFRLNVKYTIDSGDVENAGALWNSIADSFTPLLFCINGDTLVDIDIQRLCNAHMLSSATATLVGSTRTDQPHPGAVEVSLDGWVRQIHEASQDAGETIRIHTSSVPFSNSGIYVFDREALMNDFPNQMRIGKIEEGLLPHLASKRRLWAFNNGDRFLLDIGAPERFHNAMRNLNRISSFFPPAA